MSKVSSIPQGYHSVTPAIVVKDSKKAIDFYKRAFHAEELYRMAAPDGRIVHLEFRIGNSYIMMCDEMPEVGALSAQTLNGSPVSLCIYTEDADAVFSEAVEAGAQIKMPLADMFWGDRFGTLVDPFGLKWSIGTHKEDVSHDEMKRRSEKFFSAGGR